jgi:hypothetical protein
MQKITLPSDQYFHTIYDSGTYYGCHLKQDGSKLLISARRDQSKILDFYVHLIISIVINNSIKTVKYKKKCFNTFHCYTNGGKYPIICDDKVRDEYTKIVYHW